MRKRIAISGLLRPESKTHFENEDIFWDRRMKAGYLRHNRYFGARGELFFLGLFLCGAYCFTRNNLSREKNIDSLLNDRNVFYSVSLPLEMRKIN